MAIKWTQNLENYFLLLLLKWLFPGEKSQHQILVEEKQPDNIVYNTQSKDKQNKQVNQSTDTGSSGYNTQNKDKQNKQVNQSTDTDSSGYNTQNKDK